MMTRRWFCALLVIAGLGAAVRGEKIPYAKTKIVPPTPEWSAKVRENAPARPTVEAPKRKLLVFSLRTGYDHKVMPHVDRVFELLAEKSGALETAVTVDIEKLAPASLAAYDVLVLNNNCSKGPRRNLLLDELEANPKYRGLSESERRSKADALEQSILDFVAGGKGLVVVHGAPTMLNNSPKFTEMIGAAGGSGRPSPCRSSPSWLREQHRFFLACRNYSHSNGSVNPHLRILVATFCNSQINATPCPHRPWAQKPPKIGEKFGLARCLFPLFPPKVRPSGTNVG